MLLYLPRSVERPAALVRQSWSGGVSYRRPPRRVSTDVKLVSPLDATVCRDPLFGKLAHGKAVPRMGKVALCVAVEDVSTRPADEGVA